MTIPTCSWRAAYPFLDDRNLPVAVGVTIGWVVYGLVPQGEIGAILMASVLFSLVMSGIGVTVANTSDTMLQSIFVMIAVIMIFQLK
ncbi:MAG: hypothetical protein HDS82_07315 [Bacteroidales bacterium]|nr:hypothetical protein [Bacteroidales bacterium]